MCLILCNNCSDTYNCCFGPFIYIAKLVDILAWNDSEEDFSYENGQSFLEEYNNIEEIGNNIEAVVKLVIKLITFNLP